MLFTLNRLFVTVVLLLALLGILFSIATLFIPDLANLVASPDSFATRQGLVLESPVSGIISPVDSPYEANFTVLTPRIDKSDLVFIETYAGEKQLESVDCLKSYDDPVGMTEFVCTADIPYDYSQSEDYRLYAVLTKNGQEYASAPLSVSADWSGYEKNFWSFSWIIAVIIVGAYFFVLLPLSVVILSIALKVKHDEIQPGEYSMRSLMFPLDFGKTLLQKVYSFLVSPYFWAFESSGIVIILIYMALTAQVWKSSTALAAFVFSGLLTFIVPFLWCAAWWYADFRKREPLRILITFFLWGMLAALMAIGLNTITGAILEVVGFGFLSTLLLAPPIEEFYKGSGAALMSGHHEYASIEDGIVFGFVIGMGFSFIENWIYMLGNPMGSDLWSWFAVFFIRSILFSANHGVYTALTGGIIGWFIERKFRAPSLGLLIGFPIAAFFHAVHNSGTTVAELLGDSGSFLYLCLFVPIFDYGALILLLALFIWSLFRKRG